MGGSYLSRQPVSAVSSLCRCTGQRGFLDSFLLLRLFAAATFERTCCMGQGGLQLPHACRPPMWLTIDNASHRKSSSPARTKAVSVKARGMQEEV